jgi:hypothetical protein
LTSSSFLVGDNTNNTNQENPDLLPFLQKLIQILYNDRIYGNENDKAYIKSLIQRAELTSLNNKNGQVKTVNGVTSPTNQQIQQLSFSRHDSGATENNVQL